jgi:hypothetical protein
MEIDDDEINELEKIEKDNGNRISINVYGINKNIVSISADITTSQLDENAIIIRDLSMD